MYHDYKNKTTMATNRVDELKKMMVTKTPIQIKQYLIENCSLAELTEIVIKLLSESVDNKLELAKQVTVSVSDYQLIMDVFEKLFRIPESNGRGRKSIFSHLSYNEQIEKIISSRTLSRTIKQMRLDTLYYRELERKRAMGEDISNFTPPILDELLNNEEK